MFQDSTELITSGRVIDNYQPTRLYIKKHSESGLHYFGKTVMQDIDDYLGSGNRWTNHINHHGKAKLEKIANTKADLKWQEEVGIPATQAMKDTKNSQEWKETTGKEAARKISEVRKVMNGKLNIQKNAPIVG